MSQEYKTGDKRQSQSRALARMQASDVVNVAQKTPWEQSFCQFISRSNRREGIILSSEAVHRKI